mmetsp:Transcript_16520/g.16457  ORF Transcript_16520/g.16457 Transcript_16520/m.16457 type:complete len:204 (-) Transcript_16520:210-821(-)
MSSSHTSGLFPEALNWVSQVTGVGIFILLFAKAGLNSPSTTNPDVANTSEFSGYLFPRIDITFLAGSLIWQSLTSCLNDRVPFLVATFSEESSCFLSAPAFFTFNLIKFLFLFPSEQYFPRWYIEKVLNFSRTRSWRQAGMMILFSTSISLKDWHSSIVSIRSVGSLIVAEKYCLRYFLASGWLAAKANRKFDADRMFSSFLV